MTKGFKRAACASIAVFSFNLAAVPAFSETLFKIVTVKDAIIVGLNDSEMEQLGNDAGALAKSIVSKGSVSLWQYAVKKAANGDLEQAPLQKVGVMANTSLRVEPYQTPLKVLPHEMPQEANESGQTPPAEAQQEPKTEIAEEKSCVTDDAKFWQDGKKYSFRVEMKNSCAQRQRCTVNVYIVNASGPVKGTGTVTLAAAAPGQYSQNLYEIAVKQAGGMANVSRNCKAI